MDRSSRNVYGATVATLNALKYILLYGDFDEYHFFVPKQFLSARGNAEWNQRDLALINAPIKLLPIEDFAKAADTGQYQVLHHPYGFGIAPWISFRNQITTQAVPITGVTHTISYQFTLPELLHIQLSQPRPYDAIVCFGETAQKCMRDLLSSVKESFQSDTGLVPTGDIRLANIGLGVDANIYAPRDKSRLRSELGLPQNKVIFLWLGRFSHFDKSDLRPVVLAFRAALDALGPGRACLLLVGEDSRYQYSKVVSAFVERLGLSPDDVLVRADPPMIAVPLYYSAADVFICPSDNIQETFGQTVLEAMASSLPVISSDWDGFRHMVKHGETGFLIPTWWTACDEALNDISLVNPFEYDHFQMAQATAMDTRRFVEACVQLGRNKELREQMGARGRKEIMDRYDWKVIVGQYLALWAELGEIARRSPPIPRRRSYMRPSYFDNFRRYATFILNDQSVVCRAPSAPWQPDLRTCMMQYRELSAFLSERILSFVLNVTQEATPISALEQRAAAECGITATTLRLHVMWLAKYGYVTLEERQAAN